MIKQDDVHENHVPLPFPSNGPTIRAFVWLWWRAREGFGPRNIPGVCTVFQQLRLWGWGGAGSGQRFRRALEKIQKAEGAVAGSRKDPNFKVATAYNMAVGDAVIPPFVKRAIYK